MVDIRKYIFADLCITLEVLWCEGPNVRDIVPYGALKKLGVPRVIGIAQNVVRRSLHFGTSGDRINRIQMDLRMLGYASTAREEIT